METMNPEELRAWLDYNNLDYFTDSDGLIVVWTRTYEWTDGSWHSLPENEVETNEEEDSDNA